MEVTAGFIMFCGGIAGAAICLIALLATGVIFTRQRRRMLEKLQQE